MPVYRYKKCFLIVLILASASRARKKLLEQACIEHKVMPANISEEEYFLSSIQETVKKLAIEKAEFIVRKIKCENFDYLFNENSLAVLGCDSLFSFNGKIYGKPKDQQEAFDRWREMSGSFGFINTGHCLISKNVITENSRLNQFNEYETIVISTKVHFSQLTDSEIKKYIDTKEPFQCAGGFAIEGIAGLFIDSIEGCFSNVIGLSLPWLRNTLKKTYGI